MPHLHIEYSAGFEAQYDMPTLLSRLHTHMVAAPVFPTAGIRIRAFRADHAMVADGVPGCDFLAMTLAVGAGRSKDALKAEGDALFAVAQGELAAALSEPFFALSLEIREIDPDLSWKDTPIHKRLTAKE